MLATSTETESTFQKNILYSFVLDSTNDNKFNDDDLVLIKVEVF